MKSIMQGEKECYFTGARVGFHKHHCFFGNPNRKLSEKYGLWVWLRHDFHNTSDYGVHFNKKVDLGLKKQAQEMFEAHHGDRKMFRETFGKSYL